RTPQEVAANCREIAEAGAVGINLEDGREDRQGLIDVQQACENIATAKGAVSSAGYELVVNDRTGAYLRAIGEPSQRFEHAVARANAYRQAGADCLFVPGVTDSAIIQRMVREIRGPVNVLAVAGTPPIAELERLGVARVSVGSGPMRATLGLVRAI